MKSQDHTEGSKLITCNAEGFQGLTYINASIADGSIVHVKSLVHAMVHVKTRVLLCTHDIGTSESYMQVQSCLLWKTPKVEVSRPVGAVNVRMTRVHESCEPLDPSPARKERMLANIEISW